ncbi:MAG: alpha/beta hydrolase [Bacteroidota bacterium]
MLWLVLLMVIVLLLVAYFYGPRPPKVVIERPPLDLQLTAEQLDPWLSKRESSFPIRPDNEARIVWYQGQQKATEFSIVYLHGFTASQGEGDPLHREFAARYACNLYLNRMPGHGLSDPDAMVDLSPEGMLDNAIEALEIGKKLGKKVILMGTSTGCTLMLWLASRYPQDILGLICFSPNIRVANPLMNWIDGPWGKQLVSILNKGPYIIKRTRNQYWDSQYREEALLALQRLIRATMRPEVFRKIKAPVFMGYYFKNENFRDRVVSISAMLRMFALLGTSRKQKRKVAFAEAGDHAFPNRHFGQDLDSVRKESFAFAEEVLDLQPFVKESS